MPIIDDQQLKAHLTAGRIAAISVDTNIFDQKRLQLNSASMQALARLKERPFRFILSGTVAKEVVTHLTKAAADALQTARKSIGQALFAFETIAPAREDILEQISGSRSPSDAANQRWDKFVNATGCEVLDDATLVSTATIYDSYFAGEPPFGTGRKKDEFPDALALHALERTAAQEGIWILVVSSDGDWRAYCEQSVRLFLVPQIERALALVTDAPIGLRAAIHAWLEGTGNDQAKQLVAADVEHLEFTANAHPTHGEVELYAMAGKLKEVTWPDETEIDIIDVEEIDDGEGLQVVASLPLGLLVNVPVELSFSFRDSADRESISMGGREIEVEEEMFVRASLTLLVHHLATEDEAIDIVDSEIEGRYHEVDLGEVDMFEPEDYDGGDE